jgi:hypothetical protein
MSAIFLNAVYNSYLFPLTCYDMKISHFINPDPRLQLHPQDVEPIYLTSSPIKNE